MAGARPRLPSGQLRMTAKLKAPIPYWGGKSSAMGLTWPRIGDPMNFVDNFGGSFSSLWSRPHWDVTTGQFSVGKPYRTETVNDADAFLINAYRAIHRDPDAVAHWCDWPVSEADQHAIHHALCGIVPDPKEDEIPDAYKDPALRDVFMAGWRASYRPFDPLAFRERMMTDPDYYDPKIAGRWIYGKCVWIGSGWCDWRRIERHMNPEMKRINVHERGVHRKGIKHQRPQLRPAQGIQGVRLAQQRPHLDFAGRGAVSLSRRIVHLSGDSGASGNGVHGAEMRLGGLRDALRALSDRLRHVRMVCGDWTRVTSPSVTWKIGLTGMILDPPYFTNRDKSLYAVEDPALRGRDNDAVPLSTKVREWAIANGDNPKLRIALFGYDDEHGPHMPPTWDCVSWSANGGYSNQSHKGNDNRHQERIWFSPHCLKPEAGSVQMGLL